MLLQKRVEIQEESSKNFRLLTNRCETDNFKRPKNRVHWVTENMEEILKIITETEKQERK